MALIEDATLAFSSRKICLASLSDLGGCTIAFSPRRPA
jgi:hypothetical protein